MYFNGWADRIWFSMHFKHFSFFKSYRGVGFRSIQKFKRSHTAILKGILALISLEISSGIPSRIHPGIPTENISRIPPEIPPRISPTFPLEIFPGILSVILLRIS